METNHEIIAKKFNEYFINSIVDINNSIPANNLQVTYPYLNYANINTPFEFKTLNMQKLIGAMNKIKNKTSGLNNLSVNVLLDSVDLAGPCFSGCDQQIFV